MLCREWFGVSVEELITQFGLPVSMLILALLTGARGTWVFGRELEASLRREEEWKQIAYKALSIGEKVIEK